MSMGGLEDLDELYEEIILDHYRNPRHTDPIDQVDVDVEVNNPFCGDAVQIQLGRDDGRVGEVRVTGRGCAISQASASLLSDLVAGKSVEEVHQVAALVRKLLQGGQLSEGELDSLGDMAALQGVRKFPVRIKCALLSWSGLEDALKQLGDKLA